MGGFIFINRGFIRRGSGVCSKCVVCKVYVDRKYGKFSMISVKYIIEG